MGDAEEYEPVDQSSFLWAVGVESVSWRVLVDEVSADGTGFCQIEIAIDQRWNSVLGIDLKLK